MPELLLQSKDCVTALFLSFFYEWTFKKNRECMENKKTEEKNELFF